MKVTVEKSDLTLDVLVDLFSTALYGNPEWSCDYDSIDYRTKCVVSDNDCYEDKIAKCLLAGCTIEVGDCYAEDGDEVYGSKKTFWDDENEIMVYPITLDDIVEGLNKAANDGNYKRVKALLDCEGGNDMIDANVLLQYIVFDEVIYG